MTEAFELQVDGLRIAGLRAGSRGGLPVLALHGWLDNAASFEPLAALLPELDLVLIDLPGHGLSEHLPAAASYGTPQAIAHVLGILDALGWQRCVLLGHSMGAAIASLVAAVAPQRVQALIAIEALGGLAAAASDTVNRLRAHMQALARLEDKRLRVFANLDAPVRARMQANQLDEASARRLVERGVRPVEGGWCWRSDPRLMLPTAVRMSEEQVRDVIAAIACPALVIYATPAQAYFPEPERSQRAALLRHGQLHTLPGNHHLHMDQAGAIAPLLRRFLDNLAT